MTPDEAIQEARAGKLRPVYVVVGEERVLADRTIAAIRKAALEGGIDGLNEDKLTAAETDIDRVLSIVRTAPMMAKRRFVLLRGLERWDSQAGDADKPSEKASSSLDRLADYVVSPSDMTCLVLTAIKLDGRRRLAATARKAGLLVSCDPIDRRQLPGYIERAARDRGHEVEQGVADLIAEIAGPELGHVLDAIERLSLYVGPSAPIGEDAVAACVTRVRMSTIWELVGAVGRRDCATALAVLHDVYDPADRGLRLLGVLAWSIRQLLRFSVARRKGASPDEAAKAAGAPPFKARELAAQAKLTGEAELQNWLTTLLETDLALKGSKRLPLTVLESAILTMTMQAPK